MTRKIVFTYHVGYCGMDGYDFIEYPDDVTDAELDEAAWQGALANADMFGYYPEEDRPDDLDEDSEENDQYSSGIDGSWEDYNPEEHDGFSMNGTPDWQQY